MLYFLNSLEAAGGGRGVYDSDYSSVAMFKSDSLVVGSGLLRRPRRILRPTMLFILHTWTRWSD